MRGRMLLASAHLATALCGCSSEDLSPVPPPPEPEKPQPPPSESPLLPGLSGSASLTIDADALYWFDGAAGFVARRAREGGETEALAPATLSGNPFVKRDRGNLYWVDGNAGPFFRSVPVTGGESKVVAIGNGGPPGFGSSGKVFALARFADDGATAELVEVDLATERLRVLTRGWFALDVVVRGDDVWATACRADGVAHIDRTVGVRTALVDDAGCPFTLAVQGDHLYYADFHPDAGVDLRSVPVHGDGPSRSLAAVDGIEFALDDEAAYAFAGGALVRIPLDGSAATTLVERAPSLGVAVDETRVFWLAPGEDGALTVQSVAK